MPASAGVEFAPFIEKLLSQINDFCKEGDNNVDVKNIINPLLDRLGFMPARKKRTAAPKLGLSNDLINLIKEREKTLSVEIARINNAKTITVRKKVSPSKMDKSEAKYMIEKALWEIGQQRGDNSFTKKSIDMVLGYNSKTMYNQRDLHEDKIRNKDTIENRIYTDLRRELERLTAQE